MYSVGVTWMAHRAPAFHSLPQKGRGKAQTRLRAAGPVGLCSPSQLITEVAVTSTAHKVWAEKC